MAGAALLLCGCTQKSAQSPKAEHVTVRPLPSGINPDKVTDATVRANFTADDFDWASGKLKLDLYAEDTYNADEINSLKVGDTLVYNGAPQAVTKIERHDKTVAVNGDIEDGGAFLQASDKGNTYRSTELDDHPVCTKIGTVTLPVSSKLTIIDCREQPTDPSDTITSNQQKYVNGLKDYKRIFTALNTRVQIAGGTVVGITRFWIP